MYSSGSFLELLSTFSAWHLYSKLWSLLVETGLAYLPFAALICSGLKSAVEQGQSGPAGLQALRLSELRLYIAFGIVLFAMMPVVPVRPQQMVYAEQSCVLSQGELRRNLQERRHGETATRYDDILLDASGAGIPFWWWLLNSIGQGLTAAAINLIPCTVDLRSLSVNVAANRVRDPHLRLELSRFHRECWQPSYNRFLLHPPAEGVNAQGHLPPSDDLRWAGSSLLLNTPGFYDALYPENEVDAFPYVAERDQAFAPPEFAAGGWPTCRNWWADEQYGLRSRLLDTMDTSLLTHWRHRFAGKLYTDDRLLHALLRMDEALQRPSPAADFGRPGLGGWALENAMNSLAGYSALRNLPETMAVFKMMRDSAPIFQSLLLLFLIVSLPMLMAIGAYRLELVMRLSFIFLSLIFWGFWFKLVYWMDNTLSDALLGEDWLVRATATPFRVLLQVMLFGIYMLFPLLFTRFMGEAGHGMGVGIAHALGGSRYSLTTSAAIRSTASAVRRERPAPGRK